MPRIIFTLFCLALLVLEPLRAASAQSGQRLNLIRDAEIESDVRTMVTPIWIAAGLDPEAIQIMIVQDNSINAFVAGGQRIFINTGLLMRTETANQLIGVLAHETGHIAGGHLARQQEELEKLSTMQILEMLVSGALIAGSAASNAPIGRGGPTGIGTPVPGSLVAYLQYSQAQEASADQAAITYMERAHMSPKGLAQFMRIMERQERMMIGRRDAFLTDHPLTPERIATFEAAVARSPYANTPDSPRIAEMHRRIVAKLLGFTAPQAALQRYPESDHSVPARYARAIALYRSGGLGSALLTIDSLIREFPNDGYFEEIKGQMLFENGKIPDSIIAYRRAVQLQPAASIIKVDFSRVLLEANKPDSDREAIRNLELARQQEGESFDLWRLLATAYSRQGNAGMTSLARAEMAVMRGQRGEAQAHAAAAVRELPPNTPAWQRAQDIKAYIDSRPRKR